MGNDLQKAFEAPRDCQDVHISSHLPLPMLWGSYLCWWSERGETARRAWYNSSGGDRFGRRQHLPWVSGQFFETPWGPTRNPFSSRHWYTTVKLLTGRHLECLPLQYAQVLFPGRRLHSTGKSFAIRLEQRRHGTTGSFFWVRKPTGNSSRSLGIGRISPRSSIQPVIQCGSVKERYSPSRVYCG